MEVCSIKFLDAKCEWGTGVLESTQKTQHSECMISRVTKSMSSAQDTDVFNVAADSLLVLLLVLGASQGF